MLCDALRHNYILRTIEHHQSELVKANHNPGYEGLERQIQYHLDRIEKLKSGECDYDYVLESGRKYYKIMQINNQRSVHCFIDQKTGEVYKPASISAPAKGVRFNLLLIKDREWLLENADWAGSYLYK
jgi:hypothetical protein